MRDGHPSTSIASINKYSKLQPPPKKNMYPASSSYCTEINLNIQVALFWHNKLFIHVHKDNKATKCISEHYNRSRGAVRLVGE